MAVDYVATLRAVMRVLKAAPELEGVHGSPALRNPLHIALR